MPNTDLKNPDCPNGLESTFSSLACLIEQVYFPLLEETVEEETFMQKKAILRQLGYPAHSYYHKSIMEFTVDDFVELLRQAKIRQVSATSAKAKTIFRDIFTIAINRDIVRDNPINQAKSITAPRQPKLEKHVVETIIELLPKVMKKDEDYEYWPCSVLSRWCGIHEKTGTRIIQKYTMNIRKIKRKYHYLDFIQALIQYKPKFRSNSVSSLKQLKALVRKKKNEELGRVQFYENQKFL